MIKKMSTERTAVEEQANNANLGDFFAKQWKSPIVLRSNVDIFSGGLLHPRTMANLDSLGQGPCQRIKYGRKVAYPVDVLVEWISKRLVSIST